MRFEGGSINGADANNGLLSAFFMSRAFIDTGGLLTEKGVWRLGSLIWDNGDLGLYDMRLANLFNQTVGASWRYEGDRFLVLAGVGDSGYGLKGSAYAPVVTGGAMLGYTDHRHFRVSVGGEYRYENASPNNPNAPFNSEVITMEPYLRGEVMEDYFFENPTQEGQELSISATDAESYALVLQAGFGGFGRLRWNNLFAHFEKAHPSHMTTETFNGETYRLYTTGLTDQRHQLMVGNEMILSLWPGRLDLIWASLFIVLMHYYLYDEFKCQIMLNSNREGIYGRLLDIREFKDALDVDCGMMYLFFIVKNNHLTYGLEEFKKANQYIINDPIEDGSCSDSDYGSESDYEVDGPVLVL